MNEITQRKYDALILVSYCYKLKKRDIANTILGIAGTMSNNIFCISKSDTTKPRDSTSIDNVRHSFIAIDEFQDRRKKAYYLEFDIIMDHYYGSPRDQYQKNKEDKKTTIFLIDKSSLHNLCYSLSGDKLMIINVVPSKNFLKNFNPGGCEIVFPEHDYNNIIARKKNLQVISYEIYKKLF